MNSHPALPRLLIVGVGLIGGSLARAARARGLFREVIGVSRSTATLAQALSLGVVDRVEESLTIAAEDLGAGDIVVICVPTLSVAGILEQLAQCLAPSVTITDVASVKGSVISAAQRAYGFIPPQLVPGHPIAGSEQSGVAAARVDLFADHQVILTPHAETEISHLQRVRNLWQQVGAIVSEMSVEEHDEILAATSHLPHMLAYTLVDTLSVMDENREIFRYAAGGFRDFTRIAGSDPTMWHDIALANRSALLDVLARLQARLNGLSTAINTSDSEYLLNMFSRARDARNKLQGLSKRTSADNSELDPNE